MRTVSEVQNLTEFHKKEYDSDIPYTMDKP